MEEIRVSEQTTVPHVSRKVEVLVNSLFTHTTGHGLRELSHGDIFRMFEPDGSPVKCTSTGRTVFMAATDGYTVKIDSITTPLVQIYDGLVVEGKIFGKIFNDENDERVYTIEELEVLDRVLPSKHEFVDLIPHHDELLSLKFIDFRSRDKPLIEQVLYCEKIDGQAMTFWRQSRFNDDSLNMVPEIILEMRAVEVELIKPSEFDTVSSL